MVAVEWNQAGEGGQKRDRGQILAYTKAHTATNAKVIIININKDENRKKS